ncbi:hypothetical protein JAAARDRAFT_59166 [Jaapia argillacea MUCL 33604]|uniref:Uncharacterized protein n=1 Tax=Jaapia argillacea MUCL 33604 TaxID=933084 RepID=A0A067PN97_9AGAM|nr:hypothetical protein JAAARDRAFT_59166 [Jaapia argillacea MUCL 33604]
MNELEVENDRLHRASQETRLQRDAFRTQVSTFRGQLAERDSREDDLRILTSDLKNSNEALINDLSSKHRMVESLLGENRDLDKIVEELRNEVVKVTTLLAENEQLKRTVVDLKGNLESQIGQLREASSERDELKLTVADLRGQQIQFKGVSDELKAKAEVLRRQVDQLSKEKASIQESKVAPGRRLLRMIEPPRMPPAILLGLLDQPIPRTPFPKDIPVDLQGKQPVESHPRNHSEPNDPGPSEVGPPASSSWLRPKPFYKLPVISSDEDEAAPLPKPQSLPLAGTHTNHLSKDNPLPSLGSSTQVTRKAAPAESSTSKKKRPINKVHRDSDTAEASGPKVKRSKRSKKSSLMHSECV